VICGVDTTNQREVNARALPGRPSCTPVRSPVVASTASIMTVTAWSFGLLTRMLCVTLAPGLASSR
jgi:hypothetical protein